MKKYLFILFATTAFMFSCQNEEVTADKPIDNGPEVAFGVNGTTLDVVTTKAAEVITEQDAAIGLYRLKSTGYELASNQQFYYDTGSAATGTQETAGWYPKTEQDNIYLNNNQATICAYYPYVATDPATKPDDTSIILNLIPVKYNLTDGANNPDDLCFMKTPITTADNKHPDHEIPLNHAYSRITFIFTRDVSYTGTGKLTEISMQDLVTTGNENDTIISQSGTLDIAKASGKYTRLQTKDTAPLKFAGLDETLQGAEVTEEAGKLKLSNLMVPATATPAATNEVEFIFTVDDTALKTTLTGSNLQTLALLADKNYVIQVNIKGNDLEITQVTCEAWTDVTVSGELDPQYEPDEL